MVLSLALEASIQTSTRRTAVNGMFDFFNRPQRGCDKVIFLHVSVILQADPPLPTATAADGTHPTGMHSCFY